MDQFSGVFTIDDRISNSNSNAATKTQTNMSKNKHGKT